MLSEIQFKFLRSIDTPTVCNLIEIVAPERRGLEFKGSLAQNQNLGERQQAQLGIAAA